MTCVLSLDCSACVDIISCTMLRRLRSVFRTGLCAGMSDKSSNIYWDMKGHDCFGPIWNQSKIIDPIQNVLNWYNSLFLHCLFGFFRVGFGVGLGINLSKSLNYFAGTASTKLWTIRQPINSAGFWPTFLVKMSF